MNKEYAQKVEILLRMIPLITDEGVFAIHGGTAINLFVRNMPRYSVDIDITYIPVEDRETSLVNISTHLMSIKDKAMRSFKGMHIKPVLTASKLLCEYRGSQVKIEVNQTKRGIIGGAPIHMPLCNKALEEFGLYCEANIVPLTLLYGGKIAAALSRQHPRDLFDVKYMEYPLAQTREGFLFYLLGSDRPIHESFAPSLIDQSRAMKNQFEGMTDTDFSYEEFEQTRTQLISDVNALITEQDKQFLISFERCEPKWNDFEFPHFQNYPSIKWKQQNLKALRLKNSKRLYSEAEKLEEVFANSNS